MPSTVQFPAVAATVVKAEDAARAVPKAVDDDPGPWATVKVFVPGTVVHNPPNAILNIEPGEGAFCPNGSGRYLVDCVSENRDVAVVPGETAVIGTIKESASGPVKYCLAISFRLG
jgi:hypothetical protein